MAAGGEGERGWQRDLEEEARKGQHGAEGSTRVFSGTLAKAIGADVVNRLNQIHSTE
jgi:hypothetical protein